MFVYLITNLINGKKYVGQTKQKLSDRWNDHVSKTNCKYLHNAINKYGRENFSMQSICEVPTLELANEFEIEYIKRYCTMFPNGYNLKPGGDEPRPMSEEEKEKLRQRMTGNKFRLGSITSKETKEKLRLVNVGKILSEEHKSKISASHVGIFPSEESRKRMGLARLGKKLSEETKRRMSLAWVGREVSEETKARMSLAQRGRKASEETKQRQSLARLGSKRSEETKEKMKLSQQMRRLRESNGSIEPACSRNP